MIRNDVDLASRLTVIEVNMKNEVRTALALLEGTEYEDESKEWGARILSALETPWNGGSGQTMNATIASLRRRFFKVGEGLEGDE